MGKLYGTPKKQPRQAPGRMAFNNPVSRRQDPVTSHMAEEYIDSTGIRAAQCRRVLLAVEKSEGCTATELASIHGIDHHTVHKRLPDLREKNLVENKEKRQCSVTGHMAMTWYLRRGE